MRKNLTVLLLYKPSAEVHGKMRRYFYEVKNCVFVGTMNAKIREQIWSYLEKLDIEASMIIHVPTEQGFEYKTTKSDPNYTFEDFTGIILPTKIEKSKKK